MQILKISETLVRVIGEGGSIVRPDHSEVTHDICSHSIVPLVATTSRLENRGAAALTVKVQAWQKFVHWSRKRRYVCMYVCMYVCTHVLLAHSFNA